MRRLKIPLVSVAAALALILVMGAALERFTHRDEHQFVVPGLHTVREGLIPYRDYPLFHMPYLVILHGVLGAATGWPILSTRVLTALTSWLSLLLIGLYAWRRLRDAGNWRLTLAVALPALWLFQPIFAGTVTYVWNHSTPIFFVLAAFFLVVRASESTRACWLLAAGGALLALAACMRLTFLPLLAPFGIAILLFPGRTMREKVWLAGAFGGAAFVVFLPALVLFALAPEQFIFGNFEYPKLSVAWRRHPIWQQDLPRFVDPVRGFLDPQHEGLQGRELERKLRKAVSVTFVSNWPIFVLFGVSAVAAIVSLVRTRRITFPLLLVILVLPFAWWGCVAPSRFHAQYFFALTPFLLLASVEFFRTASGCVSVQWPVGSVTIILTVISAFSGFENYRFVTHLAHFEEWGPVIAHRMAQRLRASAPAGRVLTLAPLVVGEAGAPTYAELSSGEFGWRTAHLLPLEKRRRLHLVCPFDLKVWLAADAPGGVLVEGNEKQLQASIVEWAGVHGYERVRRDGLFELWQRPAVR